MELKTNYQPAKRRVSIETEYNDFIFTTSLQGFMNFEKITGKDFLAIVSEIDTDNLKIVDLVNILYAFSITEDDFKTFCEKIEISEMQEVLKALLPYLVKLDVTEEAKKK